MNYVKCNLCGADDYVILNSHYNDKYCKPGVEVRNVICKRCGLVYINPQADRDEVG